MIIRKSPPNFFICYLPFDVVSLSTFQRSSEKKLFCIGCFKLRISSDSDVKCKD